MRARRRGGPRPRLAPAERRRPARRSTRLARRAARGRSAWRSPRPRQLEEIGPAGSSRCRRGWRGRRTAGWRRRRPRRRGQLRIVDRGRLVAQARLAEPARVERDDRVALRQPLRDGRPVRRVDLSLEAEAHGQRAWRAALRAHVHERHHEAAAVVQAIAVDDRCADAVAAGRFPADRVAWRRPGERHDGPGGRRYAPRRRGRARRAQAPRADARRCPRGSPRASERPRRSTRTWPLGVQRTASAGNTCASPRLVADGLPKARSRNPNARVWFSGEYWCLWKPSLSATRSPCPRRRYTAATSSQRGFALQAGAFIQLAIREHQALRERRGVVRKRGDDLVTLHRRGPALSDVGRYACKSRHQHPQDCWPHRLNYTGARSRMSR